MGPLSPSGLSASETREHPGVTVPYPLPKRCTDLGGKRLRLPEQHGVVQERESLGLWLWLPEEAGQMHTPSMNSREGAALHHRPDKRVSSGQATTPALEPAEQEKGTGSMFRDPQGRRGRVGDCDRRKGIVCLRGCA